MTVTWKYVWRLDGKTWHMQAYNAAEDLLINVGKVYPVRGGYEAMHSDKDRGTHRASSVEACRQWLERAFERIWGTLSSRRKRYN